MTSNYKKKEREKKRMIKSPYNHCDDLVPFQRILMKIENLARYEFLTIIP